MDAAGIALIAAGLIGAVVAIVHGVLVQRLMVRPFRAAFDADRRMHRSIKQLVPMLLHFSTAAWFAGGIALMAAAYLGPAQRLVIGALVGGLYLYGAAGNAWATRGRHPGWMLYACALGLIGFAVGAG